MGPCSERQNAAFVFPRENCSSQKVLLKAHPSLNILSFERMMLLAAPSILFSDILRNYDSRLKDSPKKANFSVNEGCLLEGNRESGKHAL